MIRWRYAKLEVLIKAHGYSWLSFGRKALGFTYDERVYRVFREDGRFQRLDERVLSKVCEALRTTPCDVLEYVPDESASSRPSARKHQK